MVMTDKTGCILQTDHECRPHDQRHDQRHDLVDEATVLFASV